MAFINKILGTFLGNKSERDIREVTPMLAKIRIEYEWIKQLSNDELRAESLKLKEIIRERIRPEEERIDVLKQEAEEAEVQDSEGMYQEIDKLEERIDEKIEEVLNEVLPASTKNFSTL